MLGLFSFGSAWGIVYNAGLTYAFEVGSVDVSSGAFFELFLAFGSVHFLPIFPYVTLCRVVVLLLA